MTQAKSTQRRRRKGSGSIPAAIAEWFSGAAVERRPLLFTLPHSWQIAELWAQWAPEHPGARPPAGYEWLADPNDRRHCVPAYMKKQRPTE
ncbi:hypothetical protein [Rubrivivax gelatinosus]|uniref:hypothetical protein n=1 Tax=Rubrivivax gelatinosus TaxID=28068 RepID=UPI0002F77DFD|nr:hypothetical protein [Rubrivivax gelatinosus]MBG6082709.1 hypothetical protein [Rubrivivax gelatinosus]